MPEGTARSHFTVTKSDSTVIAADALYCGGAGDVVCQDKDGTQVTYTVPAGGYILTAVSKVMVATTATGIVGLQY